MRALRFQWLSSRVNSRRGPAGAESPAHRPIVEGSQPSSRQSSGATGECSSSEVARCGQCLTSEEVMAIEQRSEAFRRFLVGDGAMPEADLSDEARLAVVDVPRLIATIRAEREFLGEQFVGGIKPNGNGAPVASAAPEQSAGVVIPPEWQSEP